MGLYVVFKKDGEVNISSKVPKAYDYIWVHGQNLKEVLNAVNLSLPFEITSLKPPYHCLIDKSFVVYFRYALFTDHKISLHALGIILHGNNVVLSWGSLPLFIVEHIGKELKDRNFENIYLVLYLFMKRLVNSIRSALGYIEHQLDKIDEDVMKRKRIDAKRLVILKHIAKLSKVSLLDTAFFIVEVEKVTSLIKEYESDIKSLLSEIEHIDDRLLTTFSLMHTIATDQLNNVMMKLTAISAIFLPLTLIASIYGMNFKYMPELSHPLAYPLVIITMTILALSLFIYFRRKNWI